MKSKFVADTQTKMNCDSIELGRNLNWKVPGRLLLPPGDREDDAITTPVRRQGC